MNRLHFLRIKRIPGYKQNEKSGNGCDLRRLNRFLKMRYFYEKVIFRHSSDGKKE